jgi:hypothetical protein
MKFRNLSLGDTFDFIASGDKRMFNSFFKRCRKTGQRMYRSIETGDEQAAVLHIGSIDCDVYNVERHEGEWRAR